MEEAKNSDGILRKDEQDLLIAVCNDAPVNVVTRLMSPSNINVQDKDGNTALHEAVRVERWDLVPVLLQHGADVNMGNDCQKTALYLAVEHDAPADIIASLISPHNINMQDVSIFDDIQDEDDGLDNSGNCSCDVEIKNKNKKNNEDGNTVLHEALKKERWELVPVLLQHGADVNMGNSENQTPLHWAACCGAPADIITRLISPHNINMQDKDGATALHYVVNVIKKRWDLVPVLLQHGADVNLGNDCQETALHLSIENDAPVDITTQLISPHNINMQDDSGDTALHVVVGEKRWDLVPVLLQHGADINLVSVFLKVTPLHVAAWWGAPEDITTQLISSLNINMEDKDGDTALHGAVKEKSWHLVPVLLQHGADPYIHDILPEPPRPLSLQSLTIATIRSHMPVKSDEAYEKLGLPHILPELKLKPLADEIIAIKQKEDVK